jgi:hypothetical protein
MGNSLACASGFLVPLLAHRASSVASHSSWGESRFLYYSSPLSLACTTIGRPWQAAPDKRTANVAETAKWDISSQDANTLPATGVEGNRDHKQVAVQDSVQMRPTPPFAMTSKPRLIEKIPASFPNSCLGTVFHENPFRPRPASGNRVSSRCGPKQEFGTERDIYFAGAAGLDCLSNSLPPDHVN